VPRGLTALQEELIGWWAASGRDLPWRATRDPWAVLVSELMLQQTQVPRVVERWPVFLEQFPSPTACAESPVGDVVRAWAGLGYNRRAVNLHRAAGAVVERHGGALPDDLAALLALPGVGPYTARAVLVFAFERDIGLVDTNAGRFVARAGAGRALAAREAQVVADGLVPEGMGWAWGSAVFDLGALVCRRRVPVCSSCPVVGSCAWARAGWPEPDPVSRPSTDPTARAAAASSTPCAPAPGPSTGCPRPPAGPRTRAAPAEPPPASCATASPPGPPTGLRCASPRHPPPGPRRAPTGRRPPCRPGRGPPRPT
jgi:A/G-specific adenine glycosylase